MKKTKSIGVDRAIKFYNSEKWKTMTDREIVEKQLYTKELCMPFGVFSTAVNRTLGRGVLTHEFADAARIQAEFEGLVGKPTPDQVMKPLAGKKLIILQY